GLIESIDNYLSFVVRIICIILLIALVITVSISIFTRFIVFTPLNFANPLSIYLLMWLTFLCSGLAVKEGEHIYVDLFISKFNKNRFIIHIIINTLVAIFLSIVVYYGFIYAMTGFNYNDPLVFGISMFIPYLSL